LPHCSSGRRSDSRSRAHQALIIIGLAISLAVAGLAVEPQPVEAAQKKIVIVVGPVGSQTASFKRYANEVADLATSHGAKVIKIYSPYATWGRVKRATEGAHMLVYMGHGNGWPSPYAPYQTRTKNGLGLNARGGEGNSNHIYFGERFVASEIKLARNAVVLLMHVCYASGNPEWGRAAPTRLVARQRVDNFGAGFLRTGARIVLAETLGRANYIFHGLFETDDTMHEIFWSAPNAVRKYRYGFDSLRTPGAKALLDPNPKIKGSYWRSIVGDLGMHADAWR
jgi:hypothetical protein